MLKVGQSGVEAELHMVTFKKPIISNNASILLHSFRNRGIIKSRFYIHGRAYPPTLHLHQAFRAVRYRLCWDLDAGVGLHYIDTCPEVLTGLPVGDQYKILDEGRIWLMIAEDT